MQRRPTANRVQATTTPPHAPLQPRLPDPSLRRNQRRLFSLDHASIHSAHRTARAKVTIESASKPRPLHRGRKMRRRDDISRRMSHEDWMSPQPANAPVRTIGLKMAIVIDQAKGGIGIRHHRAGRDWKNRWFST